MTNKFYTLPTAEYPQFFICATDFSEIKQIFTFMFCRKIDATQSLYQLVGTSQVWGEAIDLSKLEHRNNGKSKYVPFNDDVDVIYVAIHDGGDLEGFDHMFNLGNHACTNFCTYCHTTNKQPLNEPDTTYRTQHSVNNNADRYHSITTGRTPLPSGRSALQCSQGVKGYSPIPYSAASRNVPSDLHFDTGIMTYLFHATAEHIQSLNHKSVTKQRYDHHQHQMNVINSNYQQLITQKSTYSYYKQNMRDTYQMHKLCINQINDKITQIDNKCKNVHTQYQEHKKNKQALHNFLQSTAPPNYHEQYQQQLDQYKICSNRYHSNVLKGNQAKKYRLNFATLASPIAPSNYYRHVSKTISIYNDLMAILLKHLIPLSHLIVFELEKY